MKKFTPPLIAITIFVFGVLLGSLTLTRPKLVPSNAPATEFSAERALEHVTAIAKEPHPAGSEEIEWVRAYILSELEALGLKPETQKTTIVIPQGASVIASTVINILAKIPGTDSSKAILLDAHYDTRAMTPGASDCGSCVAASLETARALLAGPPLKNDVILLFTDNEEYGGGLGAAAFVESHPWMDEIGLALNFEGLGSTGPSILFETGPWSAWAVKVWGEQASYPVGQSWFNEIYRLTPIGTDLNWFNNEGIPGLNFGYWADGTVYHSMLDNPKTIDPRSLQHHGSYALALTQHLGNLDFRTTPPPGNEAVYFTVFPGMLISYPSTCALPFAVLIGILLIGIQVFGARSKQLTLRGTLKGLGGFLVSLLVPAGLATGIWFGLTQLHGEYQSMLTFRGQVYNAHFYGIAFASLAIAISAAVLVLLRRKTQVLDLHLGTMWTFWILALISSILIPGFSYLFTWPSLFSLLGIGWLLWRGQRSQTTNQAEIIMTLGALPGIILIVPSIYVMYHFALAPMIGVLAFMAVLLLGLLTHILDRLTQSRKWLLSTSAVLVCVIFLVIGSLTASFDAEHPRPNAVAYLLDSDSGTAAWFSGGTQKDSWTAQFFKADPETSTVGALFPIAKRSSFPVLRGNALSIDLVAPVLEILDDRIADGIRTVRLRMRSPRGAETIMFDVEPYSAVQAMTLEGKRIEPIESSRDLWSLTYYAVPPEGFDVSIEVEPSTSVKLQLIDQTWDLTPEVLNNLDVTIEPRRNDMMPMPNFDYGILVVRNYQLDGIW